MTGTTFVCTSCGDTIQRRLYSVGTERYCTDCTVRGIASKFLDALANENDYPPKLGLVELDLDSYEHLLPVGFRARWEQRVKEYQVLPANRLYCPSEIYRPVLHQGEDDREDSIVGHLESCNAFMPPSDDRISQCGNCSGYACRVCRSAVFGFNHDCGSRIVVAVDDEDPFADMTLGKQYPICPNVLCGRKIELMDGCNHMTCICRTEFCFICGQPATTISGHWSLGSLCTIYNHPDEYDDLEHDEGVQAHGLVDNEADEVHQGMTNLLNLRAYYGGEIDEAERFGVDLASVPDEVAQARQLVEDLTDNMLLLQTHLLTGLDPETDEHRAQVEAFEEQHEHIEQSLVAWNEIFGTAAEAVNAEFAHDAFDWNLDLYFRVIPRLREAIAGFQAP